MEVQNEGWMRTRCAQGQDCSSRHDGEQMAEPRASRVPGDPGAAGIRSACCGSRLITAADTEIDTALDQDGLRSWAAAPCGHLELLPVPLGTIPNSCHSDSH